MREFKDKLKDLRDAKELSRSDLATILGVTPSAIGMYERGVRLPNTEVLKEIAKYFKVNFDYLLDDEYEVKQVIEDEPDFNKGSEGQIDYLVNEDAMNAAKFIYENPEYIELFESIKKVNKNEVDFIRTMIEKLK